MNNLQWLQVFYGCFVVLYFNHSEQWPWLPVSLLLFAAALIGYLQLKTKPYAWITTLIHAVILFYINLQLPIQFVTYALINVLLFLIIASANVYKEHQAKQVI